MRCLAATPCEFFLVARYTPTLWLGKGKFSDYFGTNFLDYYVEGGRESRRQIRRCPSLYFWNYWVTVKRKKTLKMHWHHPHTPCQFSREKMASSLWLPDTRQKFSYYHFQKICDIRREIPLWFFLKKIQFPIFFASPNETETPPFFMPHMNASLTLPWLNEHFRFSFLYQRTRVEFHESDSVPTHGIYICRDLLFVCATHTPRHMQIHPRPRFPHCSQMAGRIAIIMGQGFEFWMTKGTFF